MDLTIRIGTSGWSYSHWKRVFYPSELPPSGWFTYYAGQFDTVEVNNTFYRLPIDSVFDRWREQAPAGFLYAVKASRYLTHIKRLAHAEESVQLILERARRLEDRLGPVLYQLPPNWPADAARLDEFARLLPADLDHVFEFRDRSWYRDEVRTVLEKHHLSFCLFDRGGLATPLWVTGPVAYIRFHGSERSEGNYSADELRVWAERIQELASRGLRVFAYFNNDSFGHAVHNAQELTAVVMESRMKVYPGVT